MESGNHGCCSSNVTVNHHSIVGTAVLHMEYAPPPSLTVLSCEPFPSFPADFDDDFLFDLGFGECVGDPLPEMEEIKEEPWLAGGGGGGGDYVSLWLKEGEGGDLSSDGIGVVPSESDLSSFSPLPSTPTNTQHSQEESIVRFIVENDGNSLYDGYSWRKYGEKQIKHRDYRRSYYRCGHNGCMVKKQVERSSEKPTQYIITYYGRHNHYPVTNYSSIGNLS